MSNDTRQGFCCWPRCGSALFMTWPLCLKHQRQCADEYLNGGGLLPTPPPSNLPAPEPQPQPAKVGAVYYVQVGAHIKIGWTSDLAKRMRSYPPNSQLLASEPGTRTDESRMHRRFSAHRTHGREWYAPVPSVLHHIEQIRAEHGEPEAVDFGAKPVTIPQPRDVTPVQPRPFRRVV